MKNEEDNREWKHAYAYVLTYSMVQISSWAANWFAASQEIPRISRNPKVHYRTHKRPLPVSILGQPNPVHIPTSHLLEIHPNIIHPSTPRSPQWSPSLRFPHQDPIHFPLLTHMPQHVFDVEHLKTASCFGCSRHRYFTRRRNVQQTQVESFFTFTGPCSAILFLQ